MNGYVSGSLKVAIHLHPNMPYCISCRMCIYEHGYQRYRCAATDEYLFNPSKEIGLECPVEWEDA